MPSVIFFALSLTFAILVLVKGKKKKGKKILVFCVGASRDKGHNDPLYFYFRTDQKWDILDCT